MATTSPDTLWSPDSSTAYDLTTITANMQNSVQSAISTRLPFSPATVLMPKLFFTSKSALTAFTSGVRVGQEASVSGDGTPSNNGDYVRSAGAWVKAFGVAYGTFRRSDGTLNLNTGSATAMQFPSVTTELGTTTGSDSNGAFVTGFPPGRYQVNFGAQFSVNGGWVACTLALSGGTVIMSCTDESQGNSGYMALSSTGIFDLVATSKVWVSLMSNPGGLLRSPGSWALMRLG